MHCIRPIFYPFFIVRQIAKKREMDWVNMDWMNKRVDGFGLDDKKVTHFQLWFGLLIGQQLRIIGQGTRTLRVSILVATW